VNPAAGISSLKVRQSKWLLSIMGVGSRLINGGMIGTVEVRRQVAGREKWKKVVVDFQKQIPRRGGGSPPWRGTLGGLLGQFALDGLDQLLRLRLDARVEAADLAGTADQELVQVTDSRSVSF
jgi:hypothetical protein